MNRFLASATAAVGVLILAACGESPTAPQVQNPRSFDGGVVFLCDPFLDPNCNPAANPIEVLVSDLTAQINTLNLPPLFKIRLIAFVNQIPTRLAGLDAAKKLAAIQRTQNLINFVSSLTPRFIPAAKAASIIALANEVIAALNV